ncbi:collagen-like triple helix repeat-containing protein [Chitinophaga sancti]|uniref:Collagen-like protein n=1 Tax=Chitinophaga sancti TaxID=1004 RepID=A0A1K1SVT5_9BACT|nr:collagen-like protein [Chitinophaga sancti]WQD60537.1 collagen-like protein [Chitinophaga sancti]WQG87336.1 collagen-like protein [Chitinophaga sancti]SFW87973.1 hypothetical protein SAMN05661012_06172 [Chitinophaga sancti]
MKRIFCSVNGPLLLLAIAMFMFSCSKDGSTGPKGDTGATGPAGPTGPKGDAGTANVIYSDWLTVAFKADTIHTSGGGIDTIGYFADIAIPKLDAAIISSGEMKVYVNGKTAASPLVSPLPYYDVYTNLNIHATFSVGGVGLYSNGDVSTYVDNTGAKRWQYRYVLIPGGTAARKATTVDLGDYNAVKAWLGLKD